jgi:hypothetical protein
LGVEDFDNRLVNHCLRRIMVIRRMLTWMGTSTLTRLDFPFFSPYMVFRGNCNNSFWHHSSGGGEARHPQFIHPPMLPERVGASAADGRGHGHVQTHGTCDMGMVGWTFRTLR